MTAIHQYSCSRKRLSSAGPAKNGKAERKTRGPSTTTHRVRLASNKCSYNSDSNHLEHRTKTPSTKYCYSGCIANLFFSDQSLAKCAAVSRYQTYTPKLTPAQLYTKPPGSMPWASAISRPDQPCLDAGAIGGVSQPLVTLEIVRTSDALLPVCCCCESMFD